MTFPGLFTCPYTKTEKSCPDATLSLIFKLLYFALAFLFIKVSTSLIVLFSALTTPIPGIKISPFESTSACTTGFNKLEPVIAITSTESPYKFALTFSPMLNL